jgi:hypothetical protein
MSATVPVTVFVYAVCADVSTVTVEVAPDRSVDCSVMVEPLTFVTVPRAPPPKPFPALGGVLLLDAAAPVATLEDGDPPRFDTTKAAPPATAAVTNPATNHERTVDFLLPGGGASPAVGTGSVGNGSAG